MSKIQELQDKVTKWGDETFGDRQNAIGISAHLSQEVKELHNAIYRFQFPGSRIPLDIARKEMDMEFADVTMLLLEAAAKCGISTDKLVWLVEQKLEINKKRKWGEPSSDGSIQHIED